MTKFLKLIYFFLFVSLNNAYAYADPGGFMSIWQAILAFLSIILFYIFYPVRIILNFLKKLFQNIKKSISKSK